MGGGGEWGTLGITSVSLRFHIDFISISHRFEYSASISSRLDDDLLRSHFDLTSVSLRRHFVLNSLSVRSHTDLTSDARAISFRSHFEFTSVSLRSHFDLRSVSHRFQFDMSISHRVHIDSTSYDSGSYIGSTLIGGHSIPLPSGPCRDVINGANLHMNLRPQHSHT